ncbi:MAG: nucleotidyltransferase domain-containing protein [Nitrosomonadales bacterium]|nr:nucleotidyltransferase domain-containing protein [Nitrosomonadales bacterium]
MRLSAEETASIKRIVARQFGEDVEVRLFGSRVDDSKRGGDVDLYVTPGQRDDLYMKRVTCLGELERALPYPVDLVVAEPEASRPIDRIALKTGVML